MIRNKERKSGEAKKTLKEIRKLDKEIIAERLLKKVATLLNIKFELLVKYIHDLRGDMIN